MNCDIIVLIECEKTKQEEVELKQKEIEERIEIQRTEQLRILHELKNQNYTISFVSIMSEVNGSRLRLK